MLAAVSRPAHRGSLAQLKPEKDSGFEHHAISLKVSGFHKERIRPQLMRFVDIRRLGGSAEHNDSQRLERGMISNPSQYIEPIHSRHLQIQQQEIGQGILGSIFELPATLKVLNRLFPIICDL